MLFDLFGPLLGPLLIVIMVIVVFESCWRKCPPDKLMIVSGFGQTRSVSGKGTFVIPGLQRVDTLALGAVQVQLSTENEIPTQDAILIHACAVANFQIGQTPELIEIASKNYLNMDKAEMTRQVTEVMLGKMREVIGQMDLKELMRDRESFNHKVFEGSRDDLANLGLELRTFNVQDFSDSQGIIRSMGADQAAEIKKEAELAQIRAEQEVAERQNQLDLKKAELKKTADKAAAEADMVKQTVTAEKQRELYVAQQEAQIAAETKKVELAERQVAVKERELDATVRKQAEADRYAAEQKFDYYRIGHYMNIINPDYAVMGCGLNDDTRLTFSLTLQYGGWAGSGWNTGAISVDEYEQKLTSYINGLKNAKSALDAVKADLASKQQAAAGAATTVQQKQDAADSAQADVDAAKQGVADAQRAVDAAKVDVAAKQQGVTDAQTELDAAKSDLDAANAAVDTAKSTVQQKQVAFDAANAAVTAAQTKLDSAKADTEAKQQDVMDANADLAKFFQDVADAKKALDTAKSVHDSAVADQVEKATVLAAAEQKADATARALADAQHAVDAAKADTGVAADRLTGSQTDLDDAQSNLDILTDLAAKLAEAQQREQDAVKAVNDTKAALDAAKADAIAAESLVSAAEQAKAQADAKLSKLNSIDAGAAIASGHDVNADDALNALFAAAVEARAKVAPAKAILDEKQAAVDGLQSGYDAALAAYEQAKSDRIAAEQKLSDEIARQEAEEAAKQQAAYTPKHLAGTDTAQVGSLAQTGDRAGLIGETFAIGGTVLVAAGVFLDRKKRREQM